MATPTVALGAAAGEPARSAATFPPTRLCADCDLPIPAARLRVRPSAKLCARCQEKLGDVETYKEINVGSVTGQMNFAGEEETGPTQTFVTHGLGEVMDRNTEQESGTAKNTGLHVRSAEGIAAWSEKRKQ